MFMEHFLCSRNYWERLKIIYFVLITATMRQLLFLTLQIRELRHRKVR